MTTRITRKDCFRACFQWVLAAGLLLQGALGARAQDLTDESVEGAASQTTFNFVQIPDVSAIGSLAGDSESDIWATSVLESEVLHFDGKQWNKVPMATGSRTSKVAVLSSKNVWAVGQQTQATLSQIQHFDGRKWSVVPSPHFKFGETLHSVKAISANSIFAVGSSVATQNNPVPLVEHFDGTSWSVVSVPHIAGGDLFDIAIVSPSDIWAVGATRSSLLSLHFDGSQWRKISVPGGGALFSATAVSANDVWAVGSVPGSPALTEHWNGTSWKIVDNPSDTGSMLLNISAISSTDIWAVGCTVTACGDAGGPPLIEHWDGNQWNLNSVPIEDNGETALGVLTFPNRHIYVGGFLFATSGPVSFVFKGVEGQ